MNHTIVFNLAPGEFVNLEELLPGKTTILVSPLLPEQFSLSAYRQQIMLRDMLAEASQSVGFGLNNPVLIVARPTIQSIAFITGIKAAFQSVTVWFLTDVAGMYIDLTTMEAEGIDFAMTWNTIIRKTLQEEELFTQNTYNQGA